MEKKSSATMWESDFKGNLFLKMLIKKKNVMMRQQNIQKKRFSVVAGTLGDLTCNITNI